MLDNLRNFGRSWIAKIFLGVLILAVAGFGIPSVFLDLNANTVARVGDQNIAARDFDRLYRTQINNFARQTGMAPTAQQSLAYGIPNAALARLADDASTDILAQNLGLGVSDAKLASLVRRDPNFASALGLFDAAEFSAMLRQSGFTEAEYLNIQRKMANREQIGLIMDGARLPQVALDIAGAYENDQRSIDYVELNPVLFEVFDEPSEQDLSQFFDENQERFRTVETRIVQILLLTADTLAAGMEAGEAEIAAEYERTAAQYTAPERRSIHQLLLTDPDSEALFQAGIDQGRSFASVVSEAGLQTEVDDLGTVAEAEISDSALAGLAFQLPENGYDILEGPQGARVVWISAIEEGGQQPLENVRDEVARSVNARTAQDSLLSVYDEIEEARAAFLPIEDVASRYGLTIYDIALTQDGEALSEIENLPADSDQTIVNAVFAAAEDAQFTPAINLGSNRTVFFTLDEVEPARQQTLEEVRDEAIAAWQDLQTEMNMVQTAEDIVADIDAGRDLFSVASERGQIAETSGTFARGSAGMLIDQDLAQAAFQGGEGHASYLTTQNGNVIVFQVTDVVAGASDGPSQVATTLQDSFSDLLYSGFVEGLRQDAGIRINEQALNRVIGLE